MSSAALTVSTVLRARRRQGGRRL